MNDPILDELTALVAPYTDTREWVLVTNYKVCDNCHAVYEAPPQTMKQSRNGTLMASHDHPPIGTEMKSVHIDSHYTRCWKCNGDRPLLHAVKRALAGSNNDIDLAQRLGVLLADHIRKSRKEAS